MLTWITSLLAGVVLALAWDLYPPRQWAAMFKAWRHGKRWQGPRREHRWWPRSLKNWWGRRRGFGGCMRCNDSWWWKPHHVTLYTDGPLLPDGNHVAGAGCFPLCEECWVWLGTPKDRLPYYAALIHWWGSGEAPASLETQRQIFSAVAEGK